MAQPAFTRLPEAPICDDPRQVFLSLYPNRHKSILKWPARDWVTVSRHGYLSDATILSAISLQEKTFWGCRWGQQTQFFVLDVDSESQYHNQMGLARLKHLLASVGLSKSILYQSSNSGGWHIYVSFGESVDRFLVESTLKQWLIAEEIEIEKGQLEIFPSNNGLRLPLQGGFAWLDDTAKIKFSREELSTDQAIATFLKDLDENSNDWNYFESCVKLRLDALKAASAVGHLPPATENRNLHEDGFSDFFTFAGMLPEVYNAGREFWLNGLSAPSQRHQAVLCIGHYLWYGDIAEGVRALPGVARAEQRAQLIEAWLREKHNGFSKSVLKDDWNQISRDIQSACNWTAPEGAEAPQQSEDSYSNLGDRAIDRLIGLSKQTGRTWTPADFKKGNIGREEGAREQIRLGVLQLLERGRRITVRGLERVSGCDRKTIRRHVDIWGIFRLSNGGGDLRLPLGGSPAVPDLVPELSEVLELEKIAVLEVEPAASEPDCSAGPSRLPVLFVPVYYRQLVCSNSCFVITGRSAVHESLPKTRGPPAC